MHDSHENLERRIAQFAHYIELMHERRSTLAHGNCFLIFEERPDFNDRGAAQLIESKALTAVGGSKGHADGAFANESSRRDEQWRDDESSCRFIQFSFNKRYFDLDLPNSTLYRAEAELILRRRSGFFYVTDCRQFEHPAENADHFHPLRKIFVYGDERAAAEEMAFVLFSVWRFPVDWRFYVTAAAFHEATNWEKGVSIE